MTYDMVGRSKQSMLGIVIRPHLLVEKHHTKEFQTSYEMLSYKSFQSSSRTNLKIKVARDKNFGDYFLRKDL